MTDENVIHVAVIYVNQSFTYWFSTSNWLLPILICDFFNSPNCRETESWKPEAGIFAILKKNGKLEACNVSRSKIGIEFKIFHFWNIQWFLFSFPEVDMFELILITQVCTSFCDFLLRGNGRVELEAVVFPLLRREVVKLWILQTSWQNLLNYWIFFKFLFDFI